MLDPLGRQAVQDVVPLAPTLTDRSKSANFHLAGKGVNKRTGMKFRGSVTWSLRLAARTYRTGTDGRPLTRKLRVK